VHFDGGAGVSGGEPPDEGHGDGAGMGLWGMGAALAPPPPPRGPHESPKDEEGDGSHAMPMVGAEESDAKNVGVGVRTHHRAV
jgi:hypothetical protein